jgi:excisionase family DNA binding protein
LATIQNLLTRYSALVQMKGRPGAAEIIASLIATVTPEDIKAADKPNPVELLFEGAGLEIQVKGLRTMIQRRQWLQEHEGLTEKAARRFDAYFGAGLSRTASVFRCRQSAAVRARRCALMHGLAARQKGTGIMREKVWLNVDEFCAMTGLAKPTAYSMASRRQITTYKVGGALRFHLKDVEKLFKRRPALGAQCTASGENDTTGGARLPRLGKSSGHSPLEEAPRPGAGPAGASLLPRPPARFGRSQPARLSANSG